MPVTAPARRAQPPLPPFAELMSTTPTEIPLYDHQKRGLALLHKRKGKAGLFMDMGPQPVDEPVLTPTGWCALGDLTIGDRVVGASGAPVVVEEVHDFGEQDIYTVTMTDKSSTRCTLDHLWLVNSPGRKWRGFPGRVFTLRDIVARGLWDTSGNNRWVIPMTQPVQFDEAPEVPFDPWLIGYLLGNGALHGGGVEVTTADEEVVEHIRVALPDGYKLGHYSGLGYGISYSIDRTNPLRAWLVEVGLNVKSQDKFIPQSYLFTTVENRLALLQGLLDSDGYVGKNSMSVEYSSASSQLANDVRFLVQSLGGRATLNVRPAGYKGVDGVYIPCQPAHGLVIGLPHPMLPFQLTRKAERYKPRPHFAPSRSFVSVEPAGRASVRCIKVLAPDGLYLTRDCIVTHNTGKSRTALVYTMEAECRRILIVCPLSVIGVWEREIKVIGMKIPVVNLSRYVGVKDKAGRLKDLKRGDAIVLVNYESYWREPLRGSITKWEPEAIILDEGQRLKHRSTRQARFAHALGARESSRVKMVLTGTPISNGLEDVWSLYKFLDPTIFGDWATFSHAYLRFGGYLNKEIVGYNNLDKAKLIIQRTAFQCTKEECLDLPEKQDILIPITLDHETRRAYNEFKKKSIIQLQGAQGQTLDIIARIVLTLYLRLNQITGGFAVDEEGNIADLSDEKVKATVELVEDAIASNQKVVIFARFIHDIEKIVAALPKHLRVGVIQGSKGGNVAQQRTDLINTFHAGLLDVVVSQIRAGSLGIDLTPASVAIFYSTGYSLDDFLQARDRLHRIGQHHKVSYYHLLATDTLDFDVYAALSSKSSIARSVTDLSYVLNLLNRDEAFTS